MQAEDSATAATDSDGIDILLVEDEAILMMVASEVLSDAGFVVRECMSAEDALSALENGCMPRMIVTDHSLSGMTGGDFARIAKERHGIDRILIASGDSGGSAIGFPLLPKPYRDHELLERVTRMLDSGSGADTACPKAAF